MIKMVELKECFETMGLTKVKTYINSGNVIFETEDKDKKKLTEQIGKAIEKRFGFVIKIVLVSKAQLDKIVDGAPSSWKKGEGLKCYVSFIIEPTTVEKALKDIDVKEGVAFLDRGDGVLYMSTTLSGFTRSVFVKLIQKKIYKEMTMRNYNTIQKVLALMEGMDK